MADKIKYFNFPITVLDGFMVESNEVLINILYYALYAHGVKNLEYGDDFERMESSADYFGVNLANLEFSCHRGKILYESIGDKIPKVGISKGVYFDYLNTDKTEFEKACLLAYLGIKSIVHNKAYCKITNLYLLSRMDGNSHSVGEVYELSKEVAKFAKDYQLRKIKYELVNSWNLKTYARYTRGFYVSFKLDLEELVYQAEKRRKSTKMKQIKMKQDNALALAIERLKVEA